MRIEGRLVGALDRAPMHFCADCFGAGCDDDPLYDLRRNVYCVLGIPVDAIEMVDILRRIERAAEARYPLFISTPNMSFLTESRTHPQFRESLLSSNLCPADGMPIVWIARILGLPIRKVSGSDIFESLRSAERGRR